MRTNRRLHYTTWFSVLATFMLGGVVFLLLSRSATDIVAAQGFLVEIPEQLEIHTGQVLLLEVEVFRRYGPMADEIGALSSDDAPPGAVALPERFVQEQWTEFASPDVAIQQRVIVRDLTGNVVLDRRTEPEKVAAGITLPVNAPAERARILRQRLQDGVATPIEQTSNSLTIESRFPWKDHFDGDVAISIPYVHDLSPVEWIEQVTLREDGMLLDYRTFVVSQEGDKTLVSYMEAKSIELLDHAPEGLFSSP